MEKFMELRSLDNFLEEETAEMYRKRLSTRQKKVISYYTKDGYLDINNYLRGGKGTNLIIQSIKLLDSVLTNFLLKKNIVLWRGTDNFEIEHILKSNIFYDYKSTSINGNIAKMFKKGGEDGYILKIDVPKGIRGAYVGSETGYEKNEGEFILKRDSHYKFIDSNNDFIEIEMV